MELCLTWRKSSDLGVEGVPAGTRHDPAKLGNCFRGFQNRGKVGNRAWLTFLGDAEDGVVVDLLRPELEGEAEDFAAESVLAWVVDWANFRDECPDIEGGRWARRLAVALGQAWGREPA